MPDHRWVFGYGSLVSPASLGATIGREPQLGVDVFPAELTGYGRRWNCGLTTSVGLSDEFDGSIRHWTIVVLGLVAAAGECVNGLVARVDEEELPALDRREANYDRVEVTDVTIVDGVVDAPVVVYVPRPEPITRYEDGRDGGTSAIEQRYWNLVEGAFGELGAAHYDRYRASTPAPDVPVVELRRQRVERSDGA